MNKRVLALLILGTLSGCGDDPSEGGSDGPKAPEPGDDGYEGQDLSGYDFSDQSYGGTSFKGAKLVGANFSSFSCNGCDFTGADLRDANFKGAFVTESDFTDANLEGANIEGVTGFRNDVSNTICPDGKTSDTCPGLGYM